MLIPRGLLAVNPANLPPAEEVDVLVVVVRVAGPSATLAVPAGRTWCSWPPRTASAIRPPATPRAGSRPC